MKPDIQVPRVGRHRPDWDDVSDRHRRLGMNRQRGRERANLRLGAVTSGAIPAQFLLPGPIGAVVPTGGALLDLEVVPIFVEQ
jgi:hypothetical protein